MEIANRLGRHFQPQHPPNSHSLSQPAHLRQRRQFVLAHAHNLGRFRPCHGQGRDRGIEISPGAQEVIVKDNILSGKQPLVGIAEGKSKDSNIVGGQ